MRNKKAIIGALIAPALALTGGVAYASTTSGGPATVTRPAVTATVRPHSQQVTVAGHATTVATAGGAAMPAVAGAATATSGSPPSTRPPGTQPTGTAAARPATDATRDTRVPGSPAATGTRARGVTAATAGTTGPAAAETAGDRRPARHRDGRPAHGGAAPPRGGRPPVRRAAVPTSLRLAGVFRPPDACRPSPVALSALPGGDRGQTVLCAAGVQHRLIASGQRARWASGRRRRWPGRGSAAGRQRLRLRLGATRAIGAAGVPASTPQVVAGR
jgi:hypothetical protein